MNLAINLEKISKNYRVGFWGKKVKVLENVSFSVEKGSTFGLLGPNGAGKTTTIKLMTGLTKPSKGEIMVFGRPPGEIKTNRRIGYLPETSYIYNYLSGIEFLKLCANLFQISGKNFKTRSEQVLDLVGLDSKSAKKQLKTYSKGMLQRIGIAQALINDPELVFLDEPMSGLDPIGRHEVKEIIKLLRKENKTVFFNTHILADVEELCDKVAIMVKGKIVREGKISEITTPEDNLFRVLIKDLPAIGVTNLKRVSLKLSKGKSDSETYATFNDLDSAIKGMTIAKQSGGNVLEMRPYSFSLEESFVKIVQENSENKATRKEK